MNLDLYKPSDLETWINKTYKENMIYNCDDLEIEAVADIFGIDIQYYEGPSFADWNDDYSVIFLHGYMTPPQRRATFFHELCHPLRHVGYEDMGMPGTFIEHLEREANLFQLYAAVPYYMLQEFWDAGQTVYSKVLAEAFCLPEKLVLKRIDQISSRIYLEEKRLERIRKQEEGSKVKITLDHVRRIQEEYGRRRRVEGFAYGQN